VPVSVKAYPHNRVALGASLRGAVQPDLLGTVRAIASALGSFRQETEGNPD